MKVSMLEKVTMLKLKDEMNYVSTIADKSKTKAVILTRAATT